MSQNVVTCAAIITVRNTSFELEHGATANGTIQVARTDDVLRGASAALRFRPTKSMRRFKQDATLLEFPAGGGSAGPRKGGTESYGCSTADCTR